MNSIVAPSSPADFFASAIRFLGVPWVPASPREQTTKCTLRPACVSLAITPPQPNSMSSGCAPKASKGASSEEFSVGFIGSVNGVTADEMDFRSFLGAKIILFARARNVMAAMHHGLHPAQPRIARWTDLLLGERSLRQRHERISAFVQFQSAIHKTGTDNFTFVRNVHKKFRNVASRLTKIRGTRTHDTNRIEQAHTTIDLQTKVRDVRRGRDSEKFEQTMTDVVGQLTCGFILPAVEDFFEIERRKFALSTIFKDKVKLHRLIGFAMAEESSRFARIVIAVVEKENNLTTDFF